MYAIIKSQETKETDLYEDIVLYGHIDKIDRYKYFLQLIPHPVYSIERKMLLEVQTADSIKPQDLLKFMKRPSEQVLIDLFNAVKLITFRSSDNEELFLQILKYDYISHLLVRKIYNLDFVSPIVKKKASKHPHFNYSQEVSIKNNNLLK